MDTKTWFSKTRCDKCGKDLYGTRLKSLYGDYCICSSCKKEERKRDDAERASKQKGMRYLDGRGVMTQGAVYTLPLSRVQMHALSFNGNIVGYRFFLATAQGRRVYDMDTTVYVACLNKFAFPAPSGMVELYTKGNMMLSKDEIAKRYSVTQLNTVGEFEMVLKKFGLLY